MTLVISPVKVMDERSFFCQVDGGPVGTSEAETKLMVFCKSVSLVQSKPIRQTHTEAESHLELH